MVKKMSIEKILITGANGYLAQFIIDRLRSEYELTLTDIVELDRAVAGTTFIKADVTNAAKSRQRVPIKMLSSILLLWYGDGLISQPRCLRMSW